MEKENIKDGITQPSENFSVKRKKPWLEIVLISLIIIIFGAIGVLAYQNYLLKKHSQLKKNILATTEILPTPYLTATPTKIPNIDISLDNLKWLKYEPNCNNLKNKVNIFYPDGWNFREFGSFSSVVNERIESECRVSFSYGANTESQYFPEGVIADISLYTWVESQTAEDYTNLIKKQGDETPMLRKITLSNQIINNQSYIRMDNDDDSGSGFYEYVTKKGDRFFLVSFTPNIPENTNSKIPIITNIKAINQEFLNRLKIL